MKRILLLIIMCISLKGLNAQFTGTDSLRNYNNKYITNNAATAFTNLRLNTLLRGMIDWIDTARAGTGGGGVLGVDTLFALNDSTVRYRKNGVFRNVIVKGVYDNRRKVDTLYKQNDSTIAFTINGSLRTLIIPGSVDNSITTGSRTVLDDFVQNWNEHILSVNSVKSLEFNSSSFDPNYPGNIKAFRFYSDSTANADALKLTWGLKNITNDIIDSVHFELTSKLDTTAVVHYGQSGNRFARIDLVGNITDPLVQIQAYGNGKNSLYQFGKTALLKPNDSLLIAAKPAASADSVLAVRSFSNGVNTVIKVPASAISPSDTFGLQDNLGIRDRHMNMQGHAFLIDSATDLNIIGTDGGISGQLQLSNIAKLWSYDNVDVHVLSIYPKLIAFNGSTSTNPPNIWIQASDSLYTRTPTSFMVLQGDTLKIVPKDSMAAIIGGTNLSNVGSGFRLVKTPTGQIKTLVNGYGILNDSASNTDAITQKADTLSTNHLITQSDLNDSAAAIRSSAGGGIQQVLDRGSTLNRHDTLYQSGKVFVTNGQFKNEDVNRINQYNHALLAFGVSVDTAKVPNPLGGEIRQATGWIDLVGAAKGLWVWNRSQSGTSLIQHVANDSSMESKLPYIPRWDSTRFEYFIIGNYPLNDPGFEFLGVDTTVFRTHLKAMIDSLHNNRGVPLNRLIVLNGTPAPARPRTPDYAKAAYHAALEKGVIAINSFDSLSTNLANCHTDSVHLSLLGQINLSKLVLSYLDSNNSIIANNFVANKALTVIGNTYLDKEVNMHGFAHIRDSLMVDGPIVTPTYIRNRIKVYGDNTIDPWAILVGRGQSGSNRYVYGIGYKDNPEIGRILLRVFGDGGVLMGKYNPADSTSFTKTMLVATDSTRIYSTVTKVDGFLSVASGATLNGIVNITGTTSPNLQQFNAFNFGNSYKAGLKSGGVDGGPFHADIYCPFSSTSNAVRLGWMSSDGSTFNTNMSVYKSGLVNIASITNKNDTTTYKPLVVNSSGDIYKMDGWVGPVIYKGSTTWDPASIGANLSTTTTVTVTGASLGDPVIISKTSGSYSNGEIYFGYVSGSNTVTIQLQNGSGGTFDIASATYNVIVLKY